MLARSVAVACFRSSKLVEGIQDVLIGTMHQALEARNRHGVAIHRLAVGERLEGANPRCAEKTFSAPWKGATMDVIYCDLNCCAPPGRKILKTRVPQVRVLRTLTCGYPMSRPLRGDFAALRLIANMNILNSELLATLLANIAKGN